MPPLTKPPLPRLLLNNVSCIRRGQVVLRNINVSVHDGGALVLTGPNGSGKAPPSSVCLQPSPAPLLPLQVNYFGTAIISMHLVSLISTDQYKAELRWMSLKDAIKEKATVLENVLFWELLEEKYGKSKRAIELMGLGRLMNNKAKFLSMGQRKLLQLARLLAVD
ncbi:hypothetical protein MRB53_009003 [Persea americana]|uniref:Uncharacterized protein n=1 Tax=Persea americana TaxID=3435 RepID=A0ACC2LMR0_PERAE|nr:hypothetical protein MRB53_009003 [Persea americana]